MESVVFETKHCALSLDGRGNIVGLKSKFDGVERLPEGMKAPLLRIRAGGKFEEPSRLVREGGNLQLFFSASGVEARVGVAEKEEHLVLELLTLSGEVELVAWGPFPCSIKGTVGESVGVVRDDVCAFGLLALNEKTLDGDGTIEDDDVNVGAFERYQTLYKDFAWPWEKLPELESIMAGRVLRRGAAARDTEFGAVLQAYCRDRSKDRTMVIRQMLPDSPMVVPAFDDGGVVGTKIALFLCPAAEALDVIGRIEMAEGLPHPVLDGEWLKKSAVAKAPYVMIGTCYTLEEILSFTEKAGLNYVELGSGTIEEWGHFVMDRALFPENWSDFKKWVDAGKAKGIGIGVHSLCNFITPNDAYVTPVPDKRLAISGASVLAAAVDAAATEIAIEAPDFFDKKPSTFNAVLLGKEIIHYETVSKQAPWTLLGCARGAFGTKPAAHRRGERIGKLLDHGYWVFLGDANLNDEIAKNLAELCNQTGMARLAFDGLEGVISSGLGDYAMSRFVSVWERHLKPELRGKILWESSNPTHFMWHAGTSQNWGEPYYAGFRESQMEFRMLYLDFYRRNYLPAMLGAFWINVGTSVEDADWLGSHSVGFDAGYALSFAPKQESADWGNASKRNFAFDAVLATIKKWETAKREAFFSQERRETMRRMDHTCSLDKLEDGNWRLQLLKLGRVQLEMKPGLPYTAALDFENPYAEQPPRVTLRHRPSGGALVTSVTVKVNGGEAINIPCRLDWHHTLTVDENGHVETFSKAWEPLSSFELGTRLPTLRNGANRLEFEARYKGSGEAVLDIEVKTAGAKELLPSKVTL